MPKSPTIIHKITKNRHTISVKGVDANLFMCAFMSDKSLLEEYNKPGESPFKDAVTRTLISRNLLPGNYQIYLDMCCSIASRLTTNNILWIKYKPLPNHAALYYQKKLLLLRLLKEAMPNLKYKQRKIIGDYMRLANKMFYAEKLERTHLIPNEKPITVKLYD